MQRRGSGLRLAGMLAPVLFAIAFAVLEARAKAISHRLAVEDGPLEWATAVFYALAGVAFLLAARGLRVGRIWTLGLAVLCLAVAGEEISWGQRVFGFATPEAIERVNVQREFSMHNLEGVHQNVRALALLFVLGVCFVVPATNALAPLLRRFYRQLEVPLFPLVGVPWAATAIALMLFPRIAWGVADFWLDEAAEFLLAGGFLIYGVSTQQRVVAAAPALGVPDH